ncbi:MAG: galactosyldiacylglycerol synthase [Cyanobacteria bacterium]|nr:galactosyldiacylglycerol synthase [Cyanobacteriota bacterium]MDW8201176.1 galactosyldiacylglycerol synthase [Cyanobacteriota bacterium SKYGB_h_bin112]
MIKLYDRVDGTVVGRINDRQLRMLQDQLDETSAGDVDYCVDETTIDFLKSAGADRSLIVLLEQAMKDRAAIEIAWEEVQA